MTEKSLVDAYESPYAHGIMFHRFHASGEKALGQGSISGNTFEKMLLFIGIDNILSPQEWLARLQQNRLSSEHVCLTFDDGLKCQYQVCLPIMEKYVVKSFWFIFSSVFKGGLEKNELYNYFAVQNFGSFDDFVDHFISHCSQEVNAQLQGSDYQRYETEASAMFPYYSRNDLRYRYIRNKVLSKIYFEEIVDQMIDEKGYSLEEMAKDVWLTNKELTEISERGHCLGLHSYDHPFMLEKLSVREQAEQYKKNFDHVARICGHQVESMSHPLNSYNENTLDLLKNMGIVCGFRSNMTPPLGKEINPNGLEIAREDSAILAKKLETFIDNPNRG